ncbi:MAG: hypothetical protein V4623_04845 [Pseudomonadota bacterium]
MNDSDNKAPEPELIEHPSTATATAPAAEAPKPLAKRLKTWLRRHPFSSLLLALIVLYTLYTSIESWIMGPNINAHPQQKVVIEGSFPFGLGFDLILQPSYGSKNPSCKRTARAFLIFPMREVNRRMVLPFSVQRLGNDRYRAEYFLDYVAPGFCDWQNTGLGYRIAGNKQTSELVRVLDAGLTSNTHIQRICSYSSLPAYPIPKPNRLVVSCTETPMNVGDKPKTDTSQFDFIWQGEH